MACIITLIILAADQGRGGAAQEKLSGLRRCCLRVWNLNILIFWSRSMLKFEYFYSGSTTACPHVRLARHSSKEQSKVLSSFMPSSTLPSSSSSLLSSSTLLMIITRKHWVHLPRLQCLRDKQTAEESLPGVQVINVTTTMCDLGVYDHFCRY